MANDAKIMAGRRWSVDGAGLSALSRVYLVDRGALPTGAETEELDSFPGVPAIGTVHSQNANLAVVGYDVEEGDDSAKQFLKVTAKYAQIQKSTDSSQTASGDACEEWGWTSGSTSRDLTHDAATGEAVLNSAGDPFDSVPQVERPLMTFRKVLKTKSSKGAAWLKVVGTVNKDAVTIGGLTCAAHTLKVSGVDVARIFGDPFDWLYRYTITMQYLSNMVKKGTDETATEIGWDVAFVDQGLREKDGDGKLTRITDPDSEGNDVPVSLPVLLDGSGGRSSDGKAFIKVVAAYEESAIPGDFYSEPAT